MQIKCLLVEYIQYSLLHTAAVEISPPPSTVFYFLFFFSLFNSSGEKDLPSSRAATEWEQKKLLSVAGFLIHQVPSGAD